MRAEKEEMKQLVKERREREWSVFVCVVCVCEMRMGEDR